VLEDCLQVAFEGADFALGLWCLMCSFHMGHHSGLTGHSEVALITQKFRTDEKLL
jgi:hypothetical protein